MNHDSTQIDLRISRDRIASAQSFSDRTDREADDFPLSAVAVTSTLGSYPTTAASAYWVNTVSIDVADNEGAIPTFTNDSNGFAFAVNLGTSVPPMGTYVIIHNIGGAWTFRYDS